jgi:hypothetical protein
MRVPSWLVQKRICWFIDSSQACARTILRWSGWPGAGERATIVPDVKGSGAHRL